MAKDLIFAHHLVRQMDWSINTLGPGKRTARLLNHIRKELDEIAAVDGDDVYEWVDLIILACDGALRAGFTPQQISDALDDKQNVNERREWPDWRQLKEDQPIEHVKRES